MAADETGHFDNPSRGNALADVLSQIQAAAELPFPGARSLPPAAYLNADIFDREQRKLFSPSWQFVGHASEVPAGGHWMARSVADTPVLILRDEDGVVRAFANSCRHRNALIATGCGKSRRLTCPYHAWTYDLKGSLVGAPFTDIDRLDPRDRQLVRLAICDWHGLLFASLEEPEPFEAQLRQLEGTLADNLKSDLRSLWNDSEIIPSNWKLFVENFMESYHLFAVHSNSLNRTTPTADVTCEPGTLAFALHKLAVRGPDRRLTGEHEVLACIFPNTLIASNPKTTLIISAEPLGVASTRLKVHAFGSSTFVESAGGLEKASQLHRGKFVEFHQEDLQILANATTGIRSRFARSAPLTELERPLYDFTRFVANGLAPLYSPHGASVAKRVGRNMNA
jgi:phenylpropionate dioxygenase-like ring-hydroxylating dioxygenase large terminal subunit